jgi:cytoskeleton protein RodZ
MSEMISSPENKAVSSEATSAGEMIRAAREASGLHVAALAFSMKVPVKKLEALESDRLDLLLDSVFVRALASSVCRTLKIDPLPILERLPQPVAPRLGGNRQQINTPYYAPDYSQKFVLPQILTRPSVLAVAALLFAAAFLVFSPRKAISDKPDDVVQIDAAPLVKNTDGNLKDSTLPPPIVSGVQLESIGGTAESIGGRGIGSSNLVVFAEEPQDIVAFKTRGISWVEVTDARGVIQLRKSLTAGERVATSGVLPLSVVIGKADLTDVMVRGKPFLIDEFARDNVARFEVK